MKTATPTTLASLLGDDVRTPFGAKGKSESAASIAASNTPLSSEYRKAADAAAILRDRQKELTTALGFGSDTIEEINARFDLKAKLMDIDADAAKADSKITKGQAEQLKGLARETYEYEKSLRAVKAAKASQQVVDEAKKKNDEITKRDQKEVKDLLDGVVIAHEKGAAAVQKDAEAQAFELSIIGKAGVELNALNDARLYATKLTEYEASGLDKLAASRAADAFVTGEQAKRQRELVALAQKYTKELKGKNPFDIPDAGNLEAVTSGLLAASNQAAALADRLGDSGTELGNLASGGIKLAGILKSVGTLQDVSKSSSATSAQKLSAKTDTIALIVGGVIELASALDVFGTKAKERASELRIAAVEFNRALDDFIISDRTDLQDKLRQNLKSADELSVKAAGTVGFKPAQPNYKRAAEIQADVDKLRADADKIPITNSTSRRFADALRGYAEALQVVADETLANETKLNAAHDKQVARNTEDLEVRRLTAQGRTEEAAARRKALDLQNEQAEADKDLTATGLAYAAALREVIAGETAAAEATRKKADAARILDDDIAFLGLAGQGALSTTVASLSGQFAEIRNAVDGLDLSTQDGIEALRQRGIDLYNAFKSDGVITDGEQEILDAFTRIYIKAVDVFDSLAERVTRSLNKLSDDNEIFGGNQRTQFSRTVDAAKGFNPILDQLLAGVDISKSAGAASFRAQLQSLYTNLLQDGLTDEETVIVGLIKTLLSGLDNAVDETLQESEANAATAIANRAKSRERGNRYNTVNDVEGVPAFVNFLSTLAPAISNLFGEFDVSKVDGITAAKTQLSLLNSTIDSLSDEQIMAQFGLTRDELIDAILALDTSLDGLKTTALSTADAAIALANAQRDFADTVTDDYLRASGNDREADINASKAKTQSKLDKAKEFGSSQDVSDTINKTGDLDLLNINKRYDAQAATAVDRSVSASVSGAASSNATNDFTASGVTAITQTQALRLTDIASSQLAVQQQLYALWSRYFSALPTLTTPALPQGIGGFNNTSTSGNGGINITIQLNGPITGQSASEAANQLADTLGARMDQILGRRVTDASRRTGNLR